MIDNNQQWHSQFLLVADRYIRITDFKGTIIITYDIVIS